jgi:hypothetical protein
VFEPLPPERAFDVPVVLPATLPIARVLKIDTEGADVEVLGAWICGNYH